MADYKVAVELALVGNMAAALAAITRHLVGINTQVGNIEKGISAWKPALLGVIGIFAGGAIVKGVLDVAKAFNKAGDELNKMALQGQSAADIAANWKRAVEVSGVTGRPITDVLAEQRRMAYITASSEDARELSMKLAQMGTVYQHVSGKTGDQVTPILKMLEEAQILGNPARKAEIDRALEWITKDITATSGAVSPMQMMGTFLNARAARYGWASPEGLNEDVTRGGFKNPFMFTSLPYLVQKYAGGGGGGTRGPGASLMSAFTKVVQGILSQTSKEEAEKLGLLTGGHWTTPKFGHGKFGKSKFAGGEIAGSELFQLNPYEWVQRVLYPQLKKLGITSQADIIKEVTRLAGTRAAADPIIDMLLGGRARFADKFGGGQFSPFERHHAAVRRAMGIHDAFLKALEAPSVALARLGVEFENLWVILGKPLSAPFVGAVNELSSVFQQVGAWASTVDPDTIRGIAGALTGLGAGLIALGGAALIGGLITLAGPGGLLFALGTAVAAMSPKVHQAIRDLGNAISSGNMDRIKAAGNALAAACVDAIVDGLTSLINVAVGRINRAISEGLDKTMQGIYGIARPAISFGTGMGATPIPQSMAPWHWDRPYFRHHRPGEAAAAAEPGAAAGPSWMDRLDSLMRGLYGVPNQGAGRGGLLGKQSWEPGGGGGGSAQVNNVIYLDGSAIARAVHSYNVADMQFPRQSSQFDGRSGYTPPDWQPLGI